MKSVRFEKILVLIEIWQEDGTLKVCSWRQENPLGFCVPPEVGEEAWNQHHHPRGLRPRLWIRSAHFSLGNFAWFFLTSCSLSLSGTFSRSILQWTAIVPSISDLQETWSEVWKDILDRSESLWGKGLTLAQRGLKCWTYSSESVTAQLVWLTGWVST